MQQQTRAVLYIIELPQPSRAECAIGPQRTVRMWLPEIKAFWDDFSDVLISMSVIYTYNVRRTHLVRALYYGAETGVVKYVSVSSCDMKKKQFPVPRRVRHADQMYTYYDCFRPFHKSRSLKLHPYVALYGLYSETLRVRTSSTVG